jgi:hypothetical protein
MDAVREGEFLLYSLRPAMLANLELDGELDVIHERPCEAAFQRLPEVF